MGEAAMTPEVAVMDAQMEADDVEVGDDGADGAGDEDAFGRSWAIESCADAEGGDGVRKN